MRRLVYLLFLLPMLSQAQETKQQNLKTFQLNGKLRHIPDSMKVEIVFLQYRVNGEVKMDSVRPENGKYSFQGKIAEPVLAMLRVMTVPGQKTGANFARYRTMIFLEPGKQKIVSTDSFNSANISGSKSHSEYVKLNKERKPYENRQEPFIAKYREYGKAKDKVNQAKAEAEIEAIDEEIKENVYGEYLRKNPKSPVAVYALQQYAGWDINADKVNPLYETLGDKQKQYPSAITLKQNIDIAAKTGIGKTAMDFTQNDTLDQPVSLSSFRGKYVLIDFWASWCGPCRAENPNVVKVFNKYKDRNFHIVGVSLDRPGQKEKWIKAIHDDSLTWTQVSDLKFWENAVARQYGIQAIPQNLLIDPEGKIIAKNIRGEELETRVSEAVDGKKAF